MRHDSQIAQAFRRGLASLLVVGLVWGVAGAEESGTETVDNSDVTVVDKDTALPTAKIRRGDVRRVKAFLESLPEGYRARVEFRSIAPSGRMMRYPEVLTPLNPAGQPDGVQLHFGNWYQAPIREVPFEDGIRQGTERVWRNQGNGRAKLAEIPWVDGEVHGMKVTYHLNGTKASETNYEHGQPEGESRSFAPDGQLLRVATFRDGKRDGEVVDYWPGREGVVKRLVHYDEGKVDGLSKAFYADGSLKWERQFADNKPHGVERHYTAQGELERERWWWQGEAVEETEFQARSGR